MSWFKKLFNKRTVEAVRVKPYPSVGFSVEFIDRIKLHEGFRAEPYRDTVGKLTIGYGRLLDGKGITKDEANYLLMNDIEEAKQGAIDLFGNFHSIPKEKQEVLIEMVFQLGKNGVSKFINFRKAIANGDWLDAAAEMERSKWKKQTPNRVKKLATIMASNSVDITV